VTLNDEAVPVSRRALEVPQIGIGLAPLKGERRERHGNQPPETLFLDGGQTRAKLSRRLPPIPSVHGLTETLFDLPAVGVAVLQVPDDSPLALVLDDARSIRHVVSPPFAAVDRIGQGSLPPALGR
jgi:hypothetical protein